MPTFPQITPKSPASDDQADGDSIVLSPLPAKFSAAIGDLLKEGSDVVRVGWDSQPRDYAAQQARIAAITRLLARRGKWRLYPFSRTAREIIARLPIWRKRELLDELPLNVVTATSSLAGPRLWRFGRQWKKRYGRIVEYRFIDLPLSQAILAVRSMAKKVAEQPLLQVGAARSIGDSPTELHVSDDLADAHGDADVVDMRRDELLEAHTLSPRERELLQLLRSGLTRAEAARKMGVTTSTVNNCFAHIKAKAAASGSRRYFSG